MQKKCHYEQWRTVQPIQLSFPLHYQGSKRLLSLKTDTTWGRMCDKHKYSRCLSPDLKDHWEDPIRECRIKEKRTMILEMKTTSSGIWNCGLPRQGWMPKENRSAPLTARLTAASTWIIFGRLSSIMQSARISLKSYTGSIYSVFSGRDRRRILDHDFGKKVGTEVRPIWSNMTSHIFLPMVFDSLVNRDAGGMGFLCYDFIIKITSTPFEMNIRVMHLAQDIFQRR